MSPLPFPFLFFCFISFFFLSLTYLLSLTLSLYSSFLFSLPFHFILIYFCSFFLSLSPHSFLPLFRLFLYSSVLFLLSFLLVTPSSLIISLSTISIPYLSHFPSFTSHSFFTLPFCSFLLLSSSPIIYFPTTLFPSLFLFLFSPPYFILLNSHQMLLV